MAEFSRAKRAESEITPLERQRLAWTQATDREREIFRADIQLIGNRPDALTYHAPAQTKS
jgi:hypothetical protein